MRCDICPAFHLITDVDGYYEDSICNVTGEHEPGTEFKDGNYGCKRTPSCIRKKLEENEILYQKAMEEADKREVEFWNQFKKDLIKIQMGVQNDNSKCY